MLSSLLAFADMIRSVKHYFWNFEDVTNGCRSVMLWVAVLLVVAFLVSAIAVKKDAKPVVFRLFFVLALVYAVTAIVMFAVRGFIDDTMTAMTFYPLLVFAIAVVGGTVAVLVKPTKTVKIVVFALVAASLVAALVCMLVYQVSGQAAEIGGVADSSLGLYISAVALIAVIVAVGFFADRNGAPFTTRALAHAAICVALSFALSYIRFFKMPMGGSITFASLLPLMLFSYMYGTRKGLLAGLVCGVLQAIQDPWIVHPAQFALDYMIGFSAIGLAGCIRGFGLFKTKSRLQFTLGAIVAGALRFASSFFSGVFAFGSYGAHYAEEFAVPALANPWFYSFVYQAMYIIPDTLIVIVAGVLLLSSKNFSSVVERYASENLLAAK